MRPRAQVRHVITRPCLLHEQSFRWLTDIRVVATDLTERYRSAWSAGGHGRRPCDGAAGEAPASIVKNTTRIP